MITNICILDAGKKIEAAQWSMIKDVVGDHSRIAGKKLSLTTMNISVYANKNWCINQTGDGGYTASSDWIQLYIDPTKKHLIPEIIEQSFPANIYHEMHHARRMVKVGFGESLLEAVVSEGLATVFSEEMFKIFKPPWGKYDKSEIRDLFKIFEPHKYDKEFNYEEWFLGHGKPHWLGYKIGTYIVRDLKRKNVELDSGQMVDVSASVIYRDFCKLNK